MVDWVVLELSSRSEGEDPDVVRKSIQHSIRGAEVFVPAVVTQIGDDRVVHYLLDGYAFAQKTLPDTAYLKLEGTRFVQSVLTSTGVGRNRKVASVKEEDILKFRRQMRTETDQGIAVGDKVRITTGPYRNIEATVIEDLPEQQVVQVFVQLRSKQSIVSIPRSGLYVVERAPTSGLYNRISALRSWAGLALPAIRWSSPMASIGEALTRYLRVSQWDSASNHIKAFLNLLVGKVGDSFTEVGDKFRIYTTVTEYADRLAPLYAFVMTYYTTYGAFLFCAQEKYRELQTLEDFLERFRHLNTDIEGLHQQLARNEHADIDRVVENVVVDGGALMDALIVDGHLQAARAATAPGLANLTDSKGNPTGLIYGFLRILQSLRKRFPDTLIYVAWDGSSKRRKHQFGEYKANRPNGGRGPVPSFQFLRELLPRLGVVQAYNPEEEADDVIATLVRGLLKEKSNLIFSTDRDLLQLVTHATQMLAPGRGTRNEILFDRGTVVSSFGVEPDHLAHLRAF